MASDLLAIFDTLRRLIGKYEGPLTAKMDIQGRYDLWSIKDVVIDGRKKKEVAFASAIIQSSYVGFYFMPAYVENQMKLVFEPELLKLLKGKSCFHIRKMDDKLEGMIAKALEEGFRLYVERGWVRS